jgi:D-alanyl-D-alanine dipeptidase
MKKFIAAIIAFVSIISLALPIAGLYGLIPFPVPSAVAATTPAESPKPEVTANPVELTEEDKAAMEKQLNTLFIPMSQIIAQAKFDAKVDMTLATDTNPLGEKKFKDNECVLRYPAGVAVAQALSQAQQGGYEVTLRDCYHASSISKELNTLLPELYPDGENSSYSKALTVDLSLSKDGKSLDMGSEYNVLPTGDLTDEQKANQKILADLFAGTNMTQDEKAWWRFTLQSLNSSDNPDIKALDLPV